VCQPVAVRESAAGGEHGKAGLAHREPRVSTTGPGLRLDISPASWGRDACLVAGHDLSAQDASPGRPQTLACGRAVTGE